MTTQTETCQPIAVLDARPQVSKQEILEMLTRMEKILTDAIVALS